MCHCLIQVFISSSSVLCLSCVTSTASEIFVFAYNIADYQYSCTKHTELHHVCTLTHYSVDVEITTALNCLNNSIVERNPLSGNITCRDYRDTTAVDRPIYLAW